MTDSMKFAISETSRRRAIQAAYNVEHGITPETIVKVLDKVQRDTAFAVFYNAMPVAGVDGTLRDRMKGTPAEGNVHAKTGSIAHARSLSGYVTTADGERLIFSILANNWTTPTSAVTDVADQIAVALAAYRAH